MKTALKTNLEYNDNTTLVHIADLNTLTRSLCDADATSYPGADLLINTNDAYQKVHSWILQIEGTYNTDDTNYTDTPRGDFNLSDLAAGLFFYGL